MANSHLVDFRKLLVKNDIDCFLLPKSDKYISSDVMENEDRLRWITGFTGSAGTALIFRNKAYLFVDGRYEIQAKNEVDTNEFEVICLNGINVKKWMEENIQTNCRIGYDSWHNSIKDINDLEKILHAKNAFLISIKFNPVNEIFIDKLVSEKRYEVFEHHIKYAGLSRKEKINLISNELKLNKLDAYLITKPDSLSWLLNIRSHQIKNNPIFRGFAIITSSGYVFVLCDDEYDFEVSFEDNIKIYSFYDIFELGRSLSKKSVGMDFYSTPYKVYSLFRSSNVVIKNIKDFCTYPKACKNEIELEGIRQAHIRDAVAKINFLHWFDVNYGKEKISELTVVEKLEEFRKEQKNYFCKSFDTIAGFADNGAIIHYKPTEKLNKRIEDNSLLLIDSGAHYFDGTTDVTRTIVIGKPNDEMCERYTDVLKGHIDLITTIFPEGTSGRNLDSIARKYLWNNGFDYAHGTGHGVGCFASVHEGPQSISPKKGGMAGLREDMVLSIEPGFYKEGEYGIRLENLVKIVSVEFIDNHRERHMLAFEPLTLVPFDRKLIIKKQMSTEQLKWLNMYHDFVYATLKDLLEKPERDWLKTACKRI
jgi:Xaa-Pro aminopeptidase